MTVERAIELQEQSWSLEAEGKLDEAFSACREALRLIEVAEGGEDIRRRMCDSRGIYFAPAVRSIT